MYCFGKILSSSIWSIKPGNRALRVEDGRTASPPMPLGDRDGRQHAVRSRVAAWLMQSMVRGTVLRDFAYGLSWCFTLESESFPKERRCVFVRINLWRAGAGQTRGAQMPFAHRKAVRHWIKSDRRPDAALYRSRCRAGGLAVTSGRGSAVKSVTTPRSNCRLLAGSARFAPERSANFGQGHSANSLFSPEKDRFCEAPPSARPR